MGLKRIDGCVSVIMMSSGVFHLYMYLVIRHQSASEVVFLFRWPHMPNSCYLRFPESGQLSNSINRLTACWNKAVFDYRAQHSPHPWYVWFESSTISSHPESVSSSHLMRTINLIYLLDLDAVGYSALCLVVWSASEGWMTFLSRRGIGILIPSRLVWWILLMVKEWGVCVLEESLWVKMGDLNTRRYLTI